MIQISENNLTYEHSQRKVGFKDRIIFYGGS